VLWGGQLSGSVVQQNGRAAILAPKGVHMGNVNQDALTAEGQAGESAKEAEDGKTVAAPAEGTMQHLLNHSGPGGGAMRALRRGDVIEGTVVRVDKDEILVDIGFKSEGVIPSQEVSAERPDAALKVGDAVMVYVVHPETKEGNVVLSLAKANLERDWSEGQAHYDQGDTFELEVIGFNRGGLIVRFGEIRGFVPASQVFDLRGPVPADQPDQRMQKLVGRKLRLKIIEVDRAKNRLILSETSASRGWRSEQKERLLSELEKGEVRHGRVSGLADFGAFVDLGGADGLIHLSELSWQPVSHPSNVVKVGDEVDVYVMDVDKEKKRIALSLKRLQPEPWDQVTGKYQVGELVQATITKLTTFGAFARLEDGIEGLIHISELSNERIAHPKNVVNVGEVVTVKVVRIEPERRRLGLSLKQARDTEATEEAKESTTDTAEEAEQSTTDTAEEAEQSTTETA
jgi:small subunit ribosomal protein S1